MVDRHPVSRFRSNKVRALLVYLALSRGQPVLRTTVSALLWPNYEEEAARVNLRQTVAALRSNLAPYELLDSDRNYIHLRLDPATVWCDARLVEELLARCQQHDHPSLLHLHHLSAAGATGWGALSGPLAR